MALEKHEMLYEMKRIERAHPGSILPPRGLGRGRKWSVEVEFLGGHIDDAINYDYYWSVKAEINFTDSEFIMAY
jgi:hypothetical protein